jgi:hypothetical protein
MRNCDYVTLMPSSVAKKAGTRPATVEVTVISTSRLQSGNQKEYTLAEYRSCRAPA